MLCPSAMPCDPSQRLPMTRLQSSLFASPPASPPQLSSANSLGGIFSACRNLQALLASPPPSLAPSALDNTPPITPPTSSHAQLPTPPMSHTPAPLKLRLRSRRSVENGIVPERKKVVKRAPPRGLNKRRRAADDDMGRESDDEGVESDLDIGASANSSFTVIAEDEDAEPSRPSTPKRARIAPQVLPLGLERSDYHALDTMADGGQNTTEEETNPNGDEWTTEDDRVLVELVLEKLKLTKSEWQDCARSLGKDRHSLGRRWKTLMAHGDVGLKSTRGSRSRAKIHGTWR